MSTNKGILVVGPVRPYDTGDTFPVAYANEILGGHYQVSTLEDRNAIPSVRRVVGMFCTVISDSSYGDATKTYQLVGGVDNANWVPFATGEGEQGPQGYQGQQGVGGSTGATGPQGDSGATGPQGYQGVQGSYGKSMQVNAFGGASITSDVEDGTKTGPWGESFSNESGHARDYGYVVVDTDNALLYIKKSLTIGDWTAGIAFVPGPQGDTGSTGPQGYQGRQGFQGVQGSVGSAGTNGSTGATGPQGYQGNQGSRGTAGLDGPTGLRGITGSTGPSGPIGATGPQGYQGTQGQVGATGASFSIDAMSTQGSRSSYSNENIGFTWLDVAAGLLYFKVGGIDIDAWSDGVPFGDGATGASGPQGYQGTQGNQGPQGYQGTTGSQGNQGAQGHQGAQGYQGTSVTGATGPQGYQGTTGSNGATGATGPQGLTGSVGPAGSGGSGGGVNNVVEYVAIPADYQRVTIRSSSRVQGCTLSSSSPNYIATLSDTEDNSYVVGDYVVLRDAAFNVLHGKVVSIGSLTVTVSPTNSGDTFIASGSGFIQAAYGFSNIGDANGTATSIVDTTTPPYEWTNGKPVGGVVYAPANAKAHGIKLHLMGISCMERAAGVARPSPFGAATTSNIYTLTLPFGKHSGIYDDDTKTFMDGMLVPYIQSYTVGQTMSFNTNQLAPEMLGYQNRTVIMVNFGTSTGVLLAAFVLRVML